MSIWDKVVAAALILTASGLLMAFAFTHIWWLLPPWLLSTLLVAAHAWYFGHSNKEVEDVSGR